MNNKNLTQKLNNNNNNNKQQKKLERFFLFL